MPLVAREFYIDSGEECSYEVGTTYQLKYYVSSALISIDYILSPVEEMMGRFENKVEYFGYHIDGLFNFLGLINDRFFLQEFKLYHLNCEFGTIRESFDAQAE
jgi:hypothetical protein